MELRRIIWRWDELTARLTEAEPKVFAGLGRSCQPLAAERHGDGQLTVAIGCWWQTDLADLGSEPVRAQLDRVLGGMLEEKLRVVVVAWPGGMGQGTIDHGERPPAPGLLAGLPEAARAEGDRCESALQRYFYAAAYRRGLLPRCQYVLERYRLDFAFPEQRVAAEVVGWDWHRRRGAGMPPEREDQLGVANWRARWFSGGEILEDVGRCVSEVERMLAAGRGLTTRGFQAQRRYPRPPFERRRR